MQRRPSILKYLILGLLGWIIACTVTLDGNGWLVESNDGTSNHLFLPPAQAQMAPARPTAPNPSAQSTTDAPAENSESSTEAEGATETTAPEGLTAFEELTASLEKQEGLFTTYSDLQTGKAYIALLPEQLNQNFLLVATIESGVGDTGLLRGWPVNDLLVQFREIPQNRLEVVVPNTVIRNPEGQPWQQRLLDTSFSDSVIFAVDVVSVDPISQAKLIDLSDLILGRDIANVQQNLSAQTSGYSRDSSLSRLERITPFPENIEIATTEGYISAGGIDPLAALFGAAIRGLADDRGFTLGLRYSLSSLPANNGYEPRLADERVGYFVSSFRRPLQLGQSDRFVHYINRWHLEKASPTAELSPPKQPIVFWLENTIPPNYREALRSGVLLWNKAFEQAGFENAIEVQQMPDNADWDPADVRYNVIRWSDSIDSAIAGFGPSRVNPFTGQILDADVIIDANAIGWVLQQYRAGGTDLLGRSQRSAQFNSQFNGQSVQSAELETYLQLCGQRSQRWYQQWLSLQTTGTLGPNTGPNADPSSLSPSAQNSAAIPYSYCAESLGDQRAAFGALSLSVQPSLDPELLNTYAQEFLMGLTAHEVGHTLGLRHNFAGSQLLIPEQLHDRAITDTQGLVSSIMDYVPPNIAPPGTPQGDFFPRQLGPYDNWAIEYGYRPTDSGLFSSNTLAQIADRSNTPENTPQLTYITDEDIFEQIDPEAKAWDLSSDPLKFAQWQLENAQNVWKKLNRLSISPGEGYGGLRRRVDLVFSYFQSNTTMLTHYIGGQRFRRLNPQSASNQVPLEPLSGTKQREALTALNQAVFAADSFEFSEQLLNQLPFDRWDTLTSSVLSESLDYPIYDRVLTLQGFTLSELLDARRLSRLRDQEFKTDGQDLLTIAELFESLHQSIWTEVAAPQASTPAMSSLRRGLQRHHLNILSNLVLRRSIDSIGSIQSFIEFTALAATLGAPEDARVLARYQLRQLYDDVNHALSRQRRSMDVTTQAHWEDVRDRISAILEASPASA
jgi:predicted Zn-dependent protease